MGAKEILDNLIHRYPVLESCKESIWKAYGTIVDCYKIHGKVLICGNGGSAADAEHIVGELMKGFILKRELEESMKQRFIKVDKAVGDILANNLQGTLPAIALTSQSALCTAFSNDVHPDLIFAQQVLGYGRDLDVFIGLSTSGNSKNVVYGVYTAKALNMKTIGFTGQSGGIMKEICDITIQVPKESTFEIQELHLPVYHALCQMLEEFFFIK